MSVQVDPPPKAPTLTGDYKRDMDALWRYMRDNARITTQLRERTGGATDAVAAATTAASAASATAQASQASAVVPSSGAAVTITPTNPLSYIALDADTATIYVATHTRTGAGAALTGGSVATAVNRGQTYYVYYTDAANAGGAQTFLAVLQSSLATITASADNRIIGSIYIEPISYPDRVVSGGVIP